MPMFWKSAVVLATLSCVKLAEAGFYPDIWGAGIFANAADVGQIVLDNGSSAELTPSLAACSFACKILASAREGQVHIRGTAGYERAKGAFWSMAQRELYPHCIFQPRSAADVSLGLTVARESHCPFAVKSGGHGKFSGESNIDGGLTLDLVNLNQIDVVDDNQSVIIGPGNRWLDVYTALEPLGIIVIGGRDAGVGVGGFLLGGGISFHSSEYGFGADRIRSFEVVLANGTITTASPTSHADLYRALRGGGANFGIVTAFKLEAIAYKGIWGGMVTHSFDQTPELLRAFVEYGHNSLKFPKASAILNFGPDFETGESWIWYNDIQYTEPEIKPAGLRDLVSVPCIADETVISNLSTQTLGLARLTTPGRRYAYWVMSTKLDQGILQYFINTWVEEFGAMKSHIRGWFRPTFNVQVITAGMRRNMARNGGNVLGLTDSEEPLLLYNPTPKWMDADYDGTIADTVSEILAKVKAEAVRLGLDNDFLYMNYASEWQDPVASYGAKAFSFLQDVADAYDPDGVFQKLQPGSFKLKGLPAARVPLGVQRFL